MEYCQGLAMTVKFGLHVPEYEACLWNVVKAAMNGLKLF